MKNNNLHGLATPNPGSALTVAAASLLVAACGHVPVAKTNVDERKNVEIRLDTSNCSVTVMPEDILLERGKNQGITWQVIDGGSGRALREAFCIHFSPFVGKAANRCSANGRLNSPPLDGEAPATAGGVAYKYTIVLESCPETPVDPLIRVRR